MAGSELDGLDGADAHDVRRRRVGAHARRRRTADATLSVVAGAVALARGRGRGDDARASRRRWSPRSVTSRTSPRPRLMGLAADGAEEHAALLRLAAGGFRDMTRIASGHPDIWLDICEREPPRHRRRARPPDRRAERDAGDRRRDGSRGPATSACERARAARSNLPSRIARPEQLAEVRIPIPDRMGAAAEIFTIAAQHTVNIASFEVVHLAESNVGVAVVLVDAEATGALPLCCGRARVPPGDHQARMTVIAFPGDAMNCLRSGWPLLGWRLVARNRERVQ